MSEQQNSGLLVSGLSKAYDSSAGTTSFQLHPITFSLSKGELLAIIGPSGCGKTTLLRGLAGLLTLDSGSISVEGVEVTALPAEARGFGMIFQQSYLFPHLSVCENVAFGLKMRGVTRRERVRLAESYLQEVGLVGFSERMPDTLSGGQQQRVALARALIVQPSLLLLDEPFAALDPLTRIEMRKLVVSLQKKFSCTIVMVSHDRDEAFEMADRLAVMDQGKWLQCGTPYDLYTKPCSERVAMLVGCENRLSGVYDGTYFYMEGIRWLLPEKTSIPHWDGKEGTGTFIVRPESLQIVRDEAVLPTDFSARIVRAHIRQGYYELHIFINGFVLVTRVPFGIVTQPQAEDELRIRINWDLVSWIPNV